MTLKDKQHWSAKSEVKRDELKDALAQTLDWLILRRREAGMALGAAVILGLVPPLFLYGKHSRQNAAWDKLSLAELYAYSGKPDQAQTLLAQVAEEGASPAAASLAHMLEGDLRLPRGEADLALAAYEKAAATAPEALKPFAGVKGRESHAEAEFEARRRHRNTHQCRGFSPSALARQGRWRARRRAWRPA